MLRWLGVHTTSCAIVDILLNSRSTSKCIASLHQSSAQNIAILYKWHHSYEHIHEVDVIMISNVTIILQVAHEFADLHDRTGRMKAKGVIRAEVTWRCTYTLKYPSQLHAHSYACTSSTSVCVCKKSLCLCTLQTIFFWWLARSFEITDACIATWRFAIPRYHNLP